MADFNFYVGQRVEAACNAPRENHSIKAGDTGTIVYIDEDDVGVAWDADVNGHQCGCEDLCKPGHGWWVFKREIRPAIVVAEEFVPPSFDDLVCLFGS